MEENFGADDFHYFFNWKASNQDKLFKNPRSKKEIDIVNKMLVHAKIPVKAKTKYKMPTNSQIEIIDKCRMLAQADRELENMRKNYQKQMKLCGNKWKDIEDRQTQLQSNLVRYNNFIREKQGKVADGVSRSILEKKK